VVAIYASQMTISDGYSPKLPVQPTGSLLDSTHALSGVQSVGVLATDRGGGVANAAVTIDGNTVAQQVLDDNDGACAQPFQSPAPCPTSASGTIPVDTSKVPDGSHSVQVVITDAAGNTVGSTPVTITTHNAPPDPSCVPDPLAVGSGGIGGWLDQEVVKRRRGHKAVTTTKPVSNLTLPLGGAPVFHAVLSNPDGTPMANASVCIAAQNQGAEDAQPTPIAKVATDGAGNVTLPLDAGPSRTVWAIHRVGNAALATSVQVNVQPRVHVKPKRRHLRNGGVLQVRGLVVGDPVPPAGVLLEIQARVGGHWQTFRTATTDATGAWKTHYRFRRTAGLQRYVLRARVPRQSGYPYATGASKDFAVLVRG
jgi:hypothetical protein